LRVGGLGRYTVPSARQGDTIRGLSESGGIAGAAAGIGAVAFTGAVVWLGLSLGEGGASPGFLAGLLVAAIVAALVGAALGRRVRCHLRAATDSTLSVETRAHDLLGKVEHLAQMGSASRDFSTGRSTWSEGFRAILGLLSEPCAPSEALFMSCVHPADRECVAAALTEARRDGHAAEREFRIIQPDGRQRVVSGRVEVAYDAQGRPERLDATLRDVTERRRLEGELDSLIRELWRSNEELEQFAYVASHDLRQPLRVVGSYVSLMEEDLHDILSGESLEYMALVRDGVRRMDRLITDLLAYSRVGRAGDDRPVSIGRALESVLADLQFEIEECGAIISVESSLPSVMGDQSEMERLLQNLLGNALKYRCPERAPIVRIGVADLGDDWRITVADNGIGIPPEHAERVFGIFQRLHARDAYEGTGVGLAIVRKIVERHGGTSRVEPSEQGATLSFTWPKLGSVAVEAGAGAGPGPGGETPR
jgi:PAS domain S-box-containing protein